MRDLFIPCSSIVGAASIEKYIDYINGFIESVYYSLVIIKYVIIQETY